MMGLGCLVRRCCVQASRACVWGQVRSASGSARVYDRCDRNQSGFARQYTWHRMKTSVGGPAIALDEDDVEAVESPEVDDFDLDEPDGQDVFTAGISVDFDSWDPTKLHILPLGG